MIVGRPGREVGVPGVRFRGAGVFFCFGVGLAVVFVVVLVMVAKPRGWYPMGVVDAYAWSLRSTPWGSVWQGGYEGN